MMHSHTALCCAPSEEPPWWMWVIIAVTALAIIASLIGWLISVLNDRKAAARQIAAEPRTYSSLWERAQMVPYHRVGGRRGAVLPESVAEVARWNRTKMRRFDLIYAPVFKALL